MHSLHVPRLEPSISDAGADGGLSVGAGAVHAGSSEAAVPAEGARRRCQLRDGVGRVLAAGPVQGARRQVLQAGGTASLGAAARLRPTDACGPTVRRNTGSPPSYLHTLIPSIPSISYTLYPVPYTTLHCLDFTNRMPHHSSARCVCVCVLYPCSFVRMTVSLHDTCVRHL